MIPPRERGPPAVVEGVQQYGSVTQLQLADNSKGGCLRKWYFKYVMRLPDKPAGKGAERGKRGHTQLEHYLKNGNNVLGPLERLGVTRGLVPEPGKDLLVEEPLSGLLTADGVPMVGAMDLVNPRFLHEGVLEYTDWKFKKDLEKYGVQDEDLGDPEHEAGIQTLGYAEDLRLSAARFAPFDRIRLRHVQFQTEGVADVAEVALTLTLQTVADSWRTATARIIPPMREAAKATSAHDVPCNTDICEKYGNGGCAYKSVCLSKATRLMQGFRDVRTKAAQPGEAKMGMLSTMKATTTSSPIPVESVKTATQAPAKGRIISVPDGGSVAFESKQGSQYLLDGVPHVFICRTVMPGKGDVCSFMPLTGGQPVGVPPDSIVFAVADPTVPLVVPPDAPKSDPKLAAKVETVAAPAAENAAAAAATEEKGKRTRRTKAQIAEDEAREAAEKAAVNESTGLAAAAEGTHSTGPIQSESVAIPEGTLRLGPTEGFHLYFDSSPAFVPTTSLAGYVQAIDRELCKVLQLNCHDIRATDSKDYGFGKWEAWIGPLAVENPPAPGHYLVSTGDRREEVIAKALAGSGKAALVVFGGRR